MSEAVAAKKGLMTEGVIWKQLVLFSIPLLLGNLFQQLYNTVDSIVVGNYIGGNALAAVGSSTPIVNLLVGLFTGIATGSGVVVSRFFGAQDNKNVHDSVHTAIAVTFVSGIILSVAGVLLSPLLLRLIGTPEEVMVESTVYLRIYFSGVLAMMVYNMGSGILRAIGDSRTPLYFLIVSSVVNIILDLVFVINFTMGIAGVAWATLTAQVVSALLVLMKLMQAQDSYRLIVGHIHINAPILKEIVRLGLPGGIQNAIISFSNIIVQANINSFGPAAMAGCSSYTKVDGFALLPVMSFSMAVTTFTGQNVGAGNYDRVRQGAKTCLKISLGVTAVLSACVFVFGRHIIGIFSSDPEILYYGTYMLCMLSPFYMALSVNHTCAGVIRGAGASLPPMLIMVGNMCLLRMVWIALAMPFFHSIAVVFIGYSLTWVTSGLCMALYYKKARWLQEY